VLEEGDKGWVRLHITSDVPFLDILETAGQPPLPPYIKRDKSDALACADDRDRYQTVFARDRGAVAAPTAGLHFSEDTIRDLRQAGIEQTAVTLHVGLGTFRPVSVDRVEDHVMEAERYVVGEEAAPRIQAVHESSNRVVAVGSTVVRTLETVMAEHGKMVPASGRSGLFIRPPYTPLVVDAMLTNFHLPQSTLLMMVCALAGYDLTMRAYREAVEREYRFYSYGDCMLIL
jgi:S-adenosylmethionine:tRNA ribosyltransferase-isomerase